MNSTAEKRLYVASFCPRVCRPASGLGHYWPTGIRYCVETCGCTYSFRTEQSYRHCSKSNSPGAARRLVAFFCSPKRKRRKKKAPRFTARYRGCPCDTRRIGRLRNLPASKEEPRRGLRTVLGESPRSVCVSRWFTGDEVNARLYASIVQ